METKNVSESRFYESLKDIFVGARVEGISGYITLMKVKSKYFDKILKLLKGDVEEKLKEFPEFKEELYYKLWSFFKRYVSESGSLYFVSTPFSERIYEKIYTDKEDASLFWKTHMLYYVKTDRIFNSINVVTDGSKFYFDASKLEYKKAWEKRAIIYELKEVKKDGTISFYVLYSEKGRKTKLKEILKKLKEKGIKVDDEILEKAFKIFEKQSEVDYFINKNAKQFLKEQFDLWLYQYEFSDKSEFTEKRIKQLKVLQRIAYKIIDFISQFEDELVRVWNKPKFVVNSNYVITLDRVAKKDRGIKLIEKISRQDGFKKQVKDWKELGIIEKFSKEKLFVNGLNGKEIAKEYQYLPIDTRHFDEGIKFELLSLFEDLDKELDGWLIKSENYQALNTILPKFKGIVQTIYIDPPFNKEHDADYFYSVKFKDATWITMLQNRLKLVKDILKDTGCIFVRCDYNGNMYTRLLMDEIFERKNFRNEILVNRTLAKQVVKERFAQQTDSVFLYSKTDNFAPIPTERSVKEPKWHPLLHFPRKNTKPRIIFGKEYYPPKGRRWALSEDRINAFIEKGKCRVNKELEYTDYLGNVVKGIPEFLYDSEHVGNEWLDIGGYAQGYHFPTENAEELLKRIIESSSQESELIMDFFLGIGTTTAVAHKLRRKWIGVEMGEHFYSFQPEGGKLSGVLVRMKEVLAGYGNHEPYGISKEVNWKGGGFFKYFEIEQFEQTLRNVKYEDSDPFLAPEEDPYNQYIFLKDLKLLEALKIDYKKNKIKVDFSKLYKNIDVAETLSCLLGKLIKKITKEYVEFEDGEKVNLETLDYKLIKPLIWWEA